MKQTRTNIMNAVKKLIIEKGYSTMTTKDIAKEAQVNETTIFRQFGSKKDLLLVTLKEADWIPMIDSTFFEQLIGELEADLASIMDHYFQQVTPDIVRFSLGLRAQEIYQETLPYVQKIPTAYTAFLESYLSKMKEKGGNDTSDPKETAQVIFSAMVGFAFLQAFSTNEQFAREKKRFIAQTARLFAAGLKNQ
ncbi:hypothetical protein NRIC_10860 [Enterococcus florum]|uniref:HTH tetR-type domain-containing protein n=1 Tax=Enterococcus florum TaxID=2480627 RepID=A0A4P5P5R8_9ENTE|nr:TetR/AcrR family transcriptional regulator [Enterococcus florum]GCF93195.1 hypothetical protein NRIC_10860 [Enterococcus florum]